MACRQGQDRRSGSTTQNCGKCERQRIQGKFFSLVVETHTIQSFLSSNDVELNWKCRVSQKES